MFAGVRSRNAMKHLAARLAAAYNLSESTAARYSNLLGGVPEMDADDNIVVREWRGRVIARLPSSRLRETADPVPSSRP